MNSDLDLRDQLALDRTVLANERTLLAYVRTALGLVGAGVGLLHFVSGPGGSLGGWLLIAASLVTLLTGIWRYLSVRRVLRVNRLAPPG